MRRIATGTRVYIRRPTTRDEAAFLAMVRHSRPLHRPWITAPDTPSMFAEYLERGRQDDREYFLVCRVEDDAIAGVINISEIVRGVLKSGYLGYYASLDHARQGFMTEGMRVVVRHAFSALKLHRLEANIQPGNTSSIALVRKLGFRREGFSPRYVKIGGRWRDHERWAILAEEWQSRGVRHRKRLREP